MIKVYKNLNQILTLENAFKKDGRFLSSDDLSIINNGALVFDDKKILWTGASDKIPKKYSNEIVFDLSGHCLTPALVDSHTHLLFGGDRSHEYAKRLNGTSYEEIRSAGGGIAFTVKKTKEETDHILLQKSFNHIEQMIAQGLRTLEIKSGYGLFLEDELRLLHIIDKLKNYFSNKITIISTFMGAHAVPSGYTSTSFINEHVLPLIKSHHHLIDQVDIFFEVNYFDEKDVRALSTLVKKYNLPFKMHADEFTDLGGARLACELEALSADHLLGISENGIKALSKSKTVATLLPGTALFLGKKMAPAQKMAQAGVKIAIASDFNPGSCHYPNLFKIAAISTPTLGLNLCEMWSAITFNAAHSLGLFDRGVIKEGFLPLFNLYKIDSIFKISYSWNEDFISSLP
jgi:imidazolonepropionase